MRQIFPSDLTMFFYDNVKLLNNLTLYIYIFSFLAQIYVTLCVDSCTYALKMQCDNEQSSRMKEEWEKEKGLNRERERGKRILSFPLVN